MKKFALATVALASLAASPAISAQTAMSVNIELIGRGITGLNATPIAPGVACTPVAGFSACLTFAGGTGGAPANTPIATLAPITVPKGQTITSITMSGQDAAKFALSAGCNPYVAPCSLSIGPAVLPVSPVDASGNPIPYAVTLTLTAP